MTKLLFFGMAAALGLACSWDHLIWIPRSKSADPLYRFVQNGKAGYIDASGHVVIPPSFEAWGNSGSEFRNGLMGVGVSDGKYVNTTGRIVVDPKLYRGWDFSEGLAAAMRPGEDLWGYIDTTGKFAITPRFPTSPHGYVHSFQDGVAMVEVKDRFGYIDRTGEFVIRPQFLDAASFSDGMARVVVEGPCTYFSDEPCANFRYAGVPRGDSAGRAKGYPECKFTFINKSGGVISDLRFDQARGFSEGLAPVRLGKFWGFIDRSGVVVVPPQFEDAEPFASGLSRIRAGEKYGYADKSGIVVINTQFAYAESFTEGFAVVDRGDKRYRYIDATGKQAFPGVFSAASPFFKGLAHVRLLTDGGVSHAYIDTRGRHVFRY